MTTIQQIAVDVLRVVWRRALLLVMLGFVLAPIASAQTGSGYTLTWSTVDGGGGFSEGSGYTLGGTIGQSDAGPVLVGNTYTLTGGFWVGEAAALQHIYLPLVLKGL